LGSEISVTFSIDWSDVITSRYTFVILRDTYYYITIVILSLESIAGESFVNTYVRYDKYSVNILDIFEILLIISINLFKLLPSLLL